MKKNIVGILLCTLVIIPTIGITTAAKPIFDIKISGGVGVTVNITNVGNESAAPDEYVLIKATDFLIIHRATMGFTFTGYPCDNLAPGTSKSFRSIPHTAGASFYIKNYLFDLYCPINVCTINVTVNHYDFNIGDSVIDGQQNVHVLRVLPFVFLLK